MTETHAVLSDQQRAALLARLRRSSPPPAAAGQPGPLVRLSGGAGQQPLFLAHAVGGTVHGYTHLSQALGDGFRVYGIEAAGLRAGSAPLTDLGEMVDRYCQAVRDEQPTGPYQLGGWSMGGIVAFEIARRLTEAGERVSRLILIDTPGRPMWDESVDPTVAFATDVSRSLGWDRPPEPTGDPATQLDQLALRLAGPDADPATVRGDLARRLEVFVANCRMVNGYQPTGSVPTRALIAWADGSPNSSTDWSDAIRGPVTVLRLSGDHYTCLVPPWVHEIATAVPPL